jgi:hypothetical protein
VRLTATPRGAAVGEQDKGCASEFEREPYPSVRVKGHRSSLPANCERYGDHPEPGQGRRVRWDASREFSCPSGDMATAPSLPRGRTATHDLSQVLGGLQGWRFARLVSCGRHQGFRKSVVHSEERSRAVFTEATERYECSREPSCPKASGRDHSQCVHRVPGLPDLCLAAARGRRKSEGCVVADSVLTSCAEARMTRGQKTPTCSLAQDAEATRAGSQVQPLQEHSPRRTPITKGHGVPGAFGRGHTRRRRVEDLPTVGRENSLHRPAARHAPEGERRSETTSRP